MLSFPVEEVSKSQGDLGLRAQVDQTAACLAVSLSGPAPTTFRVTLALACRDSACLFAFDLTATAVQPPSLDSAGRVN